MSAHRLRLVAAALLVMTCTACGGASSSNSPSSDSAQKGDSQRSVMEPTGTPSPSVRPQDTLGRGARRIQGKGFTIAADSAFQQSQRTSSNGEPMLVLEHASHVPQVPARVAVLREPNPKQDVVEQTYALEVMKRTATKATDVARAKISWPGTQTTVLMQWTENLQTSAGPVPVRYWQLSAQVDEKLILVVVGFAPRQDFDGSGIADVVESFKPGGGVL